MALILLDTLLAERDGLGICMFVNRRLLSVLILAVVALGTLVVLPVPSWAADYSGNQSIDRPASLVAPEPDAKIAVYLRPEAKSRVGYGVNGDAVTVLEKVSDNQSVTWNHIRFDNSSQAEGWVQEEFMSSKADTPGQTPGQSQQMTTGQMAQQKVQNGGTADRRKTASQGSRYLGDQQSSAGGSTQSQFNQQPQFSHQNGQQSYSQRNQN